MTKKVVLVSGGDSLFGDLLVDCISSIRALQYEGDVAVVDFGLDENQINQLRKLDCSVHQVDIPNPYKDMIARGFLKGPLGANVLLLKPHLPSIFPEYERIIFVDADCWFQTKDRKSVV